MTHCETIRDRDGTPLAHVVVTRCLTRVERDALADIIRDHNTTTAAQLAAEAGA